MLPILRNHNHTQIIGKLECSNNRYFLNFTEDAHITEKTIVKLLNCAIIVLETYTVGKLRYLKKVQLSHLSYS